MKFIAGLLMVWTVLLLAVQKSDAQPFNQVIVFGDSNVDSGFYKALTNPGGGTNFNNLWATAVAHGAGAPTTNPGLMNSQFLAARFSLTANPSNTAGGTNYATSGAKNVTINSDQTGGFRNAVPTVTQIANYLMANGGMANAQALYLIHSGDNDVSYAIGDSGAGPHPTDPNAYVTQAANDLANAIKTLRDAGAQKIIVNGLAYSFPTGGVAANVNRRALKFSYTNTLWNGLSTLGVSFIRGDINTVRLAIAANPSKFGFTTIINTSGNVGCSKPTDIETAWSLLCSSDPAAPSTLVSPTAPQTNLFADDGHLGTAGQKLMANYLHGLIVPPRSTHDFNGDGKSDIAWRQTGGSTALWLMNSAQVSQSGVLGVIPTSWQIVGQRDFNGDGRRDLVWRDSSTGTVAVWLLNGLQVSQSGNLGAVTSNWAVAGTGDFDGNGKGDLLWRDSNTGTVAIWLLNGVQISQTGSLGSVANTWSIAGTGDFNGDGNSDILWRDSTTGTVAIWQLDGLQVTKSANLGTISGNWTIAGTADFNGDGNSDILWRDSNTGAVAIWLLDGLQISQSGGLGTVPGSWVIAATGDFNGDGKSDILWRDTATSTTAIWFMNGVQVSSSANIGTVTTDWSIQGLNVD